MRDIAFSVSVIEVLLDLNYLCASLSADEETKELAIEVEEALSKGECLYNKRYEYQKAETRKQAVVVFRDKQGDRTLSETSRFSVAVHGGLQSSGHTALFSIPSSKIIRLAYEKQKEATKQIVQKLEAFGSAHSLFPFMAKLGNYLSNFEAAQVASAEAKRNKALHSDNIEIWRAEVKKLRRGIFGELTALFPEDRDRVEAYFRPNNDRPEDAEEITPIIEVNNA